MTEKAADGETSGRYCLKVFLVLIKNLLKQTCLVHGKGFRG